MENTLTSAMSNADLADLKAKHPQDESLCTLIDGVLGIRVKEVEQVKAKENFEKDLAKTLTKLAHPDDIYNFYVHWGEVKVPDGEPELVEVIVTPAELDKDGKIVKEVVTKIEDRAPNHQEYHWIVEVNHATKVSGDTAPKSNKRAVTVFKRNGTMLEPKGNFASGQAACDYLGIPTGADDAKRVLTRDGYIHEPYNGTDFTS